MENEGNNGDVSKEVGVSQLSDRPVRTLVAYCQAFDIRGARGAIAYGHSDYGMNYGSLEKQDTETVPLELPLPIRCACVRDRRHSEESLFQLCPHIAIHSNRSDGA